MAYLLDEAPHLPNPNPQRIGDNLWRFWCCYVRRVPGARLGGIYANKPGYHNYRDALPSSDYSTGRDVAADDRGSGQLAAGIDLSNNPDQMKLQTQRLDKAARARDKRLYVHSGPTLREFIGTLDGSTVYCWVFTGGVPLGVGSDSGLDPGRDETHLWHHHGSILRQYANDRAALDGVLSVLIGESPQAYDTRMEGNDLGSITDPKQLQQFNDMAYTLTASINNPVGSGSVPHHVWAEYVTGAIQALLTAVAAVAQQVSEVDNQVAADLGVALSNLRAQVDQRLTEAQAAITAEVDATPAEVVSLLAAMDTDEGAQAFVEAVGPERAGAFADKVARLIHNDGE